MSDLYRNADDPEGVAFDVMVPCPRCGGRGEHEQAPDDPNRDTPSSYTCGRCRGSGLIPNPAITQECGTCGGSGVVPFEHAESEADCPDCDGLGYTFRKTVRVAERARVYEAADAGGNGPCIAVHPNGHVDVLRADGSFFDITHLWEQPCPEPYLDGDEDANAPVVVLPSPGEVWEIGWREAELVEVVEDCDDVPDCPSLIDLWGPRVRYWPEGVIDADEWVDITHHFPTPPKPGQRAGVLGELVLYEQARRVEP